MNQSKVPSGERANPFIGKFASQDNLSAHAKRILRRADSQKNYIIFFTARSGSSWLSDMLQSTDIAGNPREWLNPNQLAGRLRKFGSVTPESYAGILRRWQRSEGTFGIELTYPHYRNASEYLNIFDSFPDAKVIYLRRMNYVLQAISLYRAVSSQVFHAIQQRKPEEQPDVPYDQAQIMHWCSHLLQQERSLERLFVEREITPLRITYESMVGNPSSIVAEVLTFVRGEQRLPMLRIESQHQKLGSQESFDWADRFTSGNRDFVTYWNCYRGIRKVPSFGPELEPSEDLTRPKISGALSWLKRRGASGRS